ncbi:hypothetical protein MLD38_003648 [Melastoma candidum]|uniref:Uncharacterized protein n=1 Tax=Melastoma candidum TaxID=119954 RepID=A0ACB9S4M0_9MYRT|nr:hypothetical protein MLD38_003648 [Melastoma candidum]
MPTPVSSARQCLTPDAASALDDAVSVARRRGHSQTTSLHAVSALLSVPSSALRHACARSRNAAYSPRLQFKALDLCLSVSLDRLPSSGQLSDDPPVSNSLMAAIKRSQANQRRQPENFHLYHQLASLSSSSSSSSINNVIKVELRNLILSILDDPVVSRVFGEAGFRSTEIKLAIVRPLPHLFRYGRPRGGPPLFLADDPEFGLGGRRGLGFNFPFSVFPGYSDVDENCRRIGELLLRAKGRNPLLVGACATAALRNFVNSVESKKDGCLPAELSGLSIISLEDDLLKLVAEEKVDDARLDSVFSSVRTSSGPGLLVNFGDLKGYVSDSVNSYVVGLVVARFARLMEAHSGKIWLIGATTSYDTYSKFLSKFPSAEKELDMQILPITTLRPSMAESYPRSSLMESFVPFAGFFSTSSEFSVPVLGNSCQDISPHDIHNEKGKQEAARSTEGSTVASVADHYQCSLPLWLRIPELGVKDGAKSEDDGSSTIACAFQKKLPCTSQHSDKPLTNSTAPGASHFETVIGFQPAKESRQNEHNQSLSKNDSCLYETGCRSDSSSASVESQKVMTSQLTIEAPQFSKTKEGFLSKLMDKPPNVERINPCAFESPDFGGHSLSTDDGDQTSPASATSVTTSLGLGAAHTSEAGEFDVRGNTTVCPSPLCGNSTKEISRQDTRQSSPGLSPDVDHMDFKMLHGDLMKKLGRQDEVVRSISEAICRATNITRKTASRGDMWFTFLGADMIGKRRIAVALSDILHKHLIYVDLCPQGGMKHDDVIFPRKGESYVGKYRGKTTVDVIAGELAKNPCSIVFIENVEKADEQVQGNLSQAFWSGKFSDSYGREVSIRNVVVIATSNLVKIEGVLSAADEGSRYSEDRILGTQCRKMKILFEGVIGDAAVDNHGWALPGWKSLANKRKLSVRSNEKVVLLEASGNVEGPNKKFPRGLDLNLPADSTETLAGDDGGFADIEATANDNMKWLSEFIDRMDLTVTFKPYDLDSIADLILKEIRDSFRRLVGSEFLLEVDSKVIDQLVLTAYIHDSGKVWEAWLEQVLNRELRELRRRYHLAERSIIRLLTCEEEPLWEDVAFGGHLPSSIITADSLSQPGVATTL